MVLAKAGKRPRRSGSGRLRLVGGQYGGRFIQFKDAEGLRPTGERIRETVFNWLQFDVPGARVLDLYAGSGALGFEAASRGAAHVDMVEMNAVTMSQLKSQANALGAHHFDFHHSSALPFLQNTPLGYDVIFVDPPFHGNLMEQTLELLVKNLPADADTIVYLEFDRKHPPQLPDGWSYRRFKESGDVGYGLVQLPCNAEKQE